MATLIPAIGSTAFDSTGERRLAERLEQNRLGSGDFNPSSDPGNAEVGDGHGWRQCPGNAVPAGRCAAAQEWCKSTI